MPVGVWVRRTADSVLLTCWPPAPRARITSTLTSSGLNRSSPPPPPVESDSLMRGRTTTDTVLVCVRPLVSVKGTRWTLCTPDSNRRTSYEPEEGISMIPSLIPPLSVLLCWTREEPLNGRRRYIRTRSEANRAASDPPTPALSSMKHPREEVVDGGRRREGREVRREVRVVRWVEASSAARVERSGSERRGWRERREVRVVRYWV